VLGDHDSLHQTGGTTASDRRQELARLAAPVGPPRDIGGISHEVIFLIRR
jgi:hypothetical protein